MVNEDEIVRLKRLGYANTRIATEVGVSRTTVYNVLKKHGLARYRSDSMPSIIDFEVPIEYREQPAYKMLKALDKKRNGIPLGKVVEKRLDGWLGGLDTKVWTYSDAEGFFPRRRRPEHGDKPFIKGLP